MSMATVAHIKDGIVVNVSVVDENTDQTWWDAMLADGYEIVEYLDDIRVAKGWTYVAGEFVDPTPPIVETPTRILTKLAFKRQFSMEELIAFKNLTKTDATAEVFDDLLNIAGEIDLDDPLIAQGMAYLVAQGIITQAKADQIVGGT